MTIDKGNKGVITDRDKEHKRAVPRNVGRNVPRRVPARSLRQIT